MKTVFRLLLSLLFVFLLSSIYAQTVKNYDAQWKVVEDLSRNKKLPKSALAEVKKIYAQAKKENQQAQQVKALVYMIALQEQTREQNEVLSIRELEQEMASAPEPVRSLLASLQAGLYLQYLQQHRYQLYDRTNTLQFKKDDITTWTLDDFHKKIGELYLQSLRNAALLQATRLAPFDSIIEKGNVRHLRPTLYDLLAHHALNYFKSGERDIRRPAYAFAIDRPEAMGMPGVFAAANFNTRDTSSLQHKALLIYQDLTRFHSRDQMPDALIDLTLDRLVFAWQHAVMEHKDSLYVTTLQQIISSFKGNIETQQASFLLAQYHHQKAMQYQPLKDSTHRFERRKARSILLEVVKDSAQKTEAWANSYNLLQEIERTEFSFEVEKVNLPDKPFRLLVRYKNVPSLQFRIVPLNKKLKEELQLRYDNRYWETVAGLKAMRSWTQSLPATDDWQQHAVEIKVDALPVGEYLVVAESKEAKSKAMMGAQGIAVSNISYVMQGREYFVLHRETGQPLEGAQLQFFQNQYNYTTRRQQQVKTETGTADRNGYYLQKIAEAQPHNGVALHVFYRNDSLNLDEAYYTYHQREEETRDTAGKIFFFTDRSIYRPGQTVFFKGIMVQEKGKDRSVVSGRPVTIYFSNANNEVVDSLVFVTSDYGSLAGKFVIPQNILNGQFSIRGGNDFSFFSVEEYKRPKFFVAFDTVQTGYKVGDSIIVYGNAKAYAGNNISNAKVSYRVVRQPRFPYPWRIMIWPPRSKPMEIAHGTATTDASGKFPISFKAIPDRDIDPKTDPLFDYMIYADVTDANGETRSGNFVVTAGYKSLLLQVDLQPRMHIDSLKGLAVRTQNISGVFQPSVVQLTITRLIPEQRLIRNRMWQQPDLQLYSKEQYIQWFPYDAYSNESEMSSWQKGAVVMEKTDSSRQNGSLSLNGNRLAPGYYEVAVRTTDASGNEVKDLRYVELFDRTEAWGRPEFLWTKGSAGPIEPGEKTEVVVGTAADNTFVVQQRANKETTPFGSFSFIRLNREKKSFVLDATEADRGGYGVAFFFVKQNRVHQFTDVIRVPWSNKELKIEWSTFRDKTLPGSEEQWKVKVAGHKGDRVAAEMLASMYDASLDQFRPHQWTTPSIWPVFSNRFNWSGAHNFSAVTAHIKWPEHTGYRHVARIYDRLHFGITERNETFLRSGYPLERNAEMAQDVTLSRATAAPPAVQEQAGNKMRDGVTGEGAAADTIRPVMVPGPNLMVQPRTNFNETAFFFPQLKTDADGAIEFSFTTPEALTTWKLQTFSHTKELALGLSVKQLITQKELMVQPNAPRFLREGDRLEFTAKIVNLGKEEKTGQAQLMLFDATTNESVDGWFQNVFPNQYFTVAAGSSEVVRFPVEVPYLYGRALTWRIVARAGSTSDGEEQLLPVLTNKTLVTETLPLPMQGSGTKTFTFDHLLNNQSETLQHHALTVEFTSNPAWLALQALPWLAEKKNENAEQLWNRYFAHALAQTILAKAPRLKTIFESWRLEDTAALLSNLQKNSELKSVLLQETPWVLQAKNETEQKRSVALLFDLSRMTAELKTTLEQLKSFQSANGGFVWLKGGPDDRYMSQYIVTGIGHLKQLAGAIDPQLMQIAHAGITYLDKRLKEDHDRLLRSKLKPTQQQIGNIQVQYLYMRSFFRDIKIAGTHQPAYDYYRRQAQQFWTRQSPYLQGMIALHLKRTGSAATAAAILKSLEETSITHEELGMYWKEQSAGGLWWWWTAPIEMQSLMIEVFAEVANDIKTVDALKTWLLKNKQTNNWKTTRATAEACYALLLQGSDWTSQAPGVKIQLGPTVIPDNVRKTEAGTGYFSTTLPAAAVKPGMGNIQVSVSNAASGSAPSWGAVYWQYFENLEQVKTAATPLQLNKKLFVEKNSDRGPVLSPVGEGDALQVGDKITVRIELRVDRDMEYVHMKDLRAAAFEPANVLSRYRWQGGLGYYETTEDVGTHFFFDHLRKGTYVFEYSLFATMAGNFSNGITSIQSFYAPEFAAHSEGIRVTVEGK